MKLRRRQRREEEAKATVVVHGGVKRRVENNEPTKRRKSLPWDRIKILLIFFFILGASFMSKVNAPFVTAGDALREMWDETTTRVVMILIPVEIVRQLHYYLSEKWARYNTFWAEKFFGGIERQTEKRISPWTRFRASRYVKIAIFLLLYGVILNLVAESVNSPIEAITATPRLVRDGLSQIIIFVFYMFFVVSQFILLFWFLSRGGVDVVMPEEIETRYTDVWGQDHVLELLQENVAFLEKPDEIEAKGGYIPGGMLLWGPPGTGKTLMAEATAGEVGVPFVFVEPGAFLNMFFGVGVLKVKGLFRKLRKLSLRHGGVIAFFDEADSLGSRGTLATGQPGQPMEDLSVLTATCNGFGYLSGASQHHVIDELGLLRSTPEERTGGFINRIVMGGMGGGGGGMGTLQALLTEMSGLKKPRGLSNRLRKALGMKPKAPPKYRIFIMMASNMPDVLDPALLRPGRIDRLYKVGYPSREGRKATIEGYLAKVDHTLSDEETEELSVLTPYYSGAKIKDLVNEALILAMREDREIITWEDIRHAKRLKELGPADDTEYIEREQHAIAVHEACHAVVGHLMMTRTKIDMATIIRHSNALGMVKPIQVEDRVTQWRSEYEGDIMVSLASLAGERMFFEGDNSSGVSADLRNATTLAAYMQGLFGMGQGLSSLAALSLGRFGTDDPSPDIIKEMSHEVEGLLKKLYDETWQLLDRHREQVLAVAAALEERKTLSGDDIAEIMGVDAGSEALDRTAAWHSVDPKRGRMTTVEAEPLQAPPDPNPNGEQTQPDEAHSDEAPEA
jgi:ATP-dependent Zn protease